MAGIRFGCGEFVPGGEPIIVPSLPVPTPPVIIPEPPLVIIIPPFIPGGGGGNPGGGGGSRPGHPGQGQPGNPGSTRWKCVTRIEKCPDNIRVKQTIKTCTLCVKVIIGGVLSWPPGCVFPSKAACEIVCISSPIDPCITGPITGGPVRRRPVTTSYATGYKCTSVNILCLGDELLPVAQRRVARIVRNCAVCNLGQGDPLCIAQTKADCVANCIDSQTLNDCSNRSVVADILKDPNDPVTTGGGGTTSAGSISNPAEPGIVITNVNVASVVSIADPQNPLVVNTSVSQIYDNNLNFFVLVEPQVGLQVANNSYQQIFNTSVDSQVGVLLVNENSLIAWSEQMIFSVTIDNIRNSLNPTLLRSFRSIHYPGGQIVGEDIFLNVVLSHLLTGTLSEFDVEYYNQTASKQESDRKIKYVGLTDTDISERAGLGVIAAGAIVADPTQQNPRHERQIRRQRRLNTDIRAQVPVEPLLGVCLPLFLTDAGICVNTLSDGVVSVPTGDGDGYYIQVDVAQGDCAPLVTISDFSSTYYVPPDVRFNALTLFKEDSNITLTASSLEDNHEFTSGSLGASELKPLYLTLDLDSMTYASNKNPLVAKYGGNYVIEDDQFIIDEHTTNNGLAITRVNIDYRDPLYQYILDSSSVAISMNDINFKSIKDPKDFQGGIRISRNIPFGLVITPVVGAKHNPFNGFSKIQSVESRVVRSLGFKPDISSAEKDPIKPPLTELNLYNEASGALSVGLVEPSDTQNIVHRYEASNTLYTESFFRDGKYTTSCSPVSSHGISYLIKDVMDHIITTYDPEDIVWFDVLRRMPLNRIGELMVNNNIDLFSRLERGYRNGVLIYSVIKSLKNQHDTILADDDKVVIKIIDRNGSNS